MAITDVTTLLAAHNDYAPTSAEVTAWNTVKAFGSLKTVTKAGLFGADLTTFNADCVTLAAACKPADYADYNGWAIGVNWAPDSGTPPTANDINGLSFNTLQEYVQVKWIAAGNELKSSTISKTPAAAVPATGDLTLAAATNAFTAWSGKAVVDANLKTAQGVFFFQKAGDTVYFEAGDTDDLWAGDATLASNVETAAFVFVGAASLTAAAASVLVASLLF